MLCCQPLFYTVTISIASVTKIAASPAAANPYSSQKSIDDEQWIDCPYEMLLAANISASSDGVLAAPMRCCSTWSSILPSVAPTNTNIKSPLCVCLTVYTIAQVRYSVNLFF